MRKLLLMLTILLIAQVTQAATADYYFVVNNDSQAGLLDHVIDSLNTFLDGSAAINDTAVRYGNLLKFVVLVGIAGVTIRLAVMHIGGNARYGFMQYIVYLLTIFFVLALAYGPRATVMVQTKYNTGYAVKTLPELAAWGFGAFFTIKKELDDLSQIAYDIPDPSDNVFMPGGPEGLGYVGGQSVLAGMYRNAQFSWYENGDALSSMWSRYVRDCFLLPASSSIGGETVLNNTLRSADLVTVLDPATTGYDGEFIQYDGQVDTCSNFWTNKLHPEILNFENNVSESRKYLNLGSAIGYFGALIDDTGAMSAAGDLKAAVTQTVLSNEFSTTYSAMGIAGEVMSSGAAQATADVQLNGISTGLYMAEQLPMVAFIVFLLMVAAFPFIIAFALLPGSLTTLVNYSRTLLWVSLWEPMGNILGTFFDYRFMEISKDLNFPTSGAGEMLIAPANLINVSSEAATMAGIAGFMFLAVQGLSWMLITGSGQMLGNLMSHFGSAFANRANADAQMQTRTEMAARNLLSQEMGEQISMREMYQYNAIQQAGNMAGATGGAMSSFGRNLLPAGRDMTHTSTAKTAFGHGQDVGMAHELGTGTTAANTGRRLATKSGGAMVEESHRYGSDVVASDSGHVEGAKKAGASMAVMESYGSDTTAAFDVAGKAASEAEGIVIGETSTVSNKNEALSRGTTTGTDKGMGNTARTDVLNQQGSEDRMTTLDHQAMKDIVAPSEMIKKAADKWDVSKQEASDRIVENVSTKDASGAVSDDASFKVQGGADGTLDNSRTLGEIQGETANSTNAEIKEANAQGVSTRQITDVQAEKSIGRDAETAHIKEENNRQAREAGQRLKMAQEKMDALAASKNELSSEQEVIGKEAEARKELTQHRDKLDKQISRLKEWQSKSSVPDQFDQKIADLQGERDNVQNKLTDMAKDNVNQHLNVSNTQKDINRSEGAEAELAAAKTVKNEADQKASALNNQGANMAQSDYETSSREQAKTMQLQNGGRDRYDSGTYEGVKSAIDVAGEITGKNMSAEDLVHKFEAMTPNAQEVFKQLGVENGTTLQKAIAVAAIGDALHERTSIGGKRWEVAYDTNGNVVFSDSSSATTTDGGYHNRMDLTGSATGLHTGVTTSVDELAMRKGFEQIVRTAEGMITKSASESGRLARQTSPKQSGGGEGRSDD